MTRSEDGWLARAWRNPWALQLVTTAVFLGVLLWRVDVRDAVDPFREARYGWVILAMAIFPVTRLLDTYRWRLYLERVGRPPFPGLLGAFLVGNLVNSVLPARVGDLVKIQVVANRHGLSRAGLVASRAVESIIDGITFLLIVLLGAFLVGTELVPAPLLWTLIGAAAAGFAVSALAARFLPRRPPQWRAWRLLAPAVRQAIQDAWPRFVDGLETMRNPRLLGLTVGLNLATWFVQVLMFFIFGLAFGLGLALGAYLGVTIAANVVADFPITFQNLGTYEVAMVEVLALQGVAREEALAFAVTGHLLTNAAVAVMGLSAMWVMRLRPREVFALRRAPEASDE